jgi:hypothetical protein
MDAAAKKIQDAFRKKFGVKNNANFLKKFNKANHNRNYNNEMYGKLEKYSAKRGYGNNTGRFRRNLIKKKVQVPGANTAARKIQAVVRAKFGIKNNADFLRKMAEWEVMSNYNPKRNIYESKLEQYARNRREDIWTLRKKLTAIQTNNKFLNMMTKQQAGRGLSNNNYNRIYNYADNKGYSDPETLMNNLYRRKHRDPKFKKATGIIERAYNKHLAKGNIKTDEEYLKKYQSNKVKLVYKNRFRQKHYPGENTNNIMETIYLKRSRDPKRLPAVQKIQKAYTGYVSNTLKMIISFISDLRKDGRFANNVKVLTRLTERINLVLHKIKSNWGNGAQNKITTLIGPCHIRPDEVPRKYLSSMYNQLKYVTSEYSKFSSVQKKNYRDVLADRLGERPCLENLLDGMADAVATSAFEWRGKSKIFEVTPLVVNNSRYLSHLMGPAISSWYSTLSKNNKKSLENKNLNARKQLFWNMVKSRNVVVMSNNGPGYSKVKNYNVNGKRFKSSNQANTLGNF